MDTDWKTDAVRFAQIERQLYELGSLVRGHNPMFASRISDLADQIDEVRKAVAAVQEKCDKIGDFVKAHVKEHKNGGAT